MNKFRDQSRERVPFPIFYLLFVIYFSLAHYRSELLRIGDSITTIPYHYYYM